MHSYRAHRAVILAIAQLCCYILYTVTLSLTPKIQGAAKQLHTVCVVITLSNLKFSTISHSHRLSQGSVVTQIVLGGLTMHRAVANFL